MNCSTEGYKVVNQDDVLISSKCKNEHCLEENTRNVKSYHNHLLASISSNPNISNATLRLINDLSKKNPTEEINTIIKKALEGSYCESTSYIPDPQLMLAHHLKDAGCDDLARAVYNNVYAEDDVNEIE